MALQVWLPLNGTLENKGLNNITVTNNDATINNNGKIGKCYSFNGSSNFITITNYIPTLSFSVGGWYYFNTISSSKANTIVTCRQAVGEGIAIFETGGGRLRFDVGSSNDVMTDVVLSTNKWFHIFATYDGTTKIIYLNGNPIQTIIKQKSSIENLNTLGWSIGASQSSNVLNGNNNYLNGKVNDFRIYNHCLSPKEVKEISKTLFAHYTLDDNYQTMNNCFAYPTFNTSTATGGWSHWHPSGSSTEWSQNTNKEYIYNKNNTYSHKFRNKSGSYSICYQSPAFDGGYRSAQAIIKIEGGGVPNPAKLYWSANSVTLSTPTTFTPLGDGFYLMKRDGFMQSGSNDLVSIVSIGVTVYISEAYLENGKQFCSNIIGSNTTTVYDSSGYENNGTIIGTLTLEKDTPRYIASTTMNNTGTSNHIEANAIGVSDNIFTVSFWVKANKSKNQVFLADPKISIGIFNNLLTTLTTTSGLFNTTNFKNDKWNHIVVIRNNTSYSVYINGLSETRSSTNNYYMHNASKLWLFNRSTNNTYAANTTMSDVRIYATALSSKDILELYNTSISIDNSGNMFSYEFNEENVSQQKILKTGIVKIDNFIEYNNKFKILDDGSVFMQILHHNNPASNLFTEQNCWFNNDTNLFSNLIVLKDCPMLNNLSTYEFLVCEKLTSSSSENQIRFVQTTNPALSSTVSGYTIISGTTSHLNGLVNDNAHGCFDKNGNEWWCCCGCFVAYQGGIPGFDGVVTSGYLDLYIKIPDKILKGDFDGFLKFYKKSILLTQLLEI